VGRTGKTIFFFFFVVNDVAFDVVAVAVVVVDIIVNI